MTVGPQTPSNVTQKGRALGIRPAAPGKRRIPRLLNDRMPRIAEAFAEEVASGGSIRSFASSLGLPLATITGWMQKHQIVREAYDQARSVRADLRAERIDEVADGALAGEHEVPAATLRIKADQWLARCERPGYYGDRTQVTGHGGGPIEVRWRKDDQATDVQCLTVIRSPEEGEEDS